MQGKCKDAEKNKSLEILFYCLCAWCHFYWNYITCKHCLVILVPNSRADSGRPWLEAGRNTCAPGPSGVQLPHSEMKTSTHLSVTRLGVRWWVRQMTGKFTFPEGETDKKQVNKSKSFQILRSHLNKLKLAVVRNMSGQCRGDGKLGGSGEASLRKHAWVMQEIHSEKSWGKAIQERVNWCKGPGAGNKLHIAGISRWTEMGWWGRAEQEVGGPYKP